jgi:hypothetical protein
MALRGFPCQRLGEHQPLPTQPLPAMHFQDIIATLNGFWEI